MFDRRRFIPWIALPVSFLAGLLADRFFFQVTFKESSSVMAVRQGRYGLINPLIECETGGHGGAKELRPFQKELETLVSGLEGDPLTPRVSVYFRDLDNGPWIGVGENEVFLPASLVKVPVIIACLKQAEADPAFLNRPIPFLGAPSDPLDRQEGGDPYRILQQGRTYTVDELMRLAAAYSANDAYYLLLRAVDPSVIRTAFYDLGLHADPNQYLSPHYRISIKDYAAFFRILYNSTYLNREMSERALEYFSQSTFNIGLVAGLPSQTLVSHKFGERSYVSEGGRVLVLHDVGIVYHPDRPYLLGVMTAGTDRERMARAIASVSRFVYEQIERQSNPRDPDLPP